MPRCREYEIAHHPRFHCVANQKWGPKQEGMLLSCSVCSRSFWTFALNLGKVAVMQIMMCAGQDGGEDGHDMQNVGLELFPVIFSSNDTT